MDLMRIGSKLISRTRLIRRLDEILQMRVRGKSQQETAEALGVDRTFISRLEALGEVRKGGKVALIGFPIENKRELEEAARAEGVDFVLLFTEEERWRFAEGMSGAELINEIMRIGAELRSYDAVILLGSDMRIGLMESLIGKENVIGIEIGRSPIRGGRPGRGGPDRRAAPGFEGLAVGPAGQSWHWGASAREAGGQCQHRLVEAGPPRRAGALGEQFVIERRGTDGDLERAARMIRELDGKVDAIGLGGMDLYISAGGRRYVMRDAQRLVRCASTTPVVDGSGLKNSLERWVVRYLEEEGIVRFSGTKVLMMAAVDRFGMAEELVARGAQMTFGDLIFALGVPVPIRSLVALDRLARVLAPVITQLPFKWLYPTGDKQEATASKFSRYFREAAIIAGDFHFIRRYLPEDLRGKGIITNTVTQRDVEFLKDGGSRSW